MAVSASTHLHQPIAALPVVPNVNHRLCKILLRRRLFHAARDSKPLAIRFAHRDAKTHGVLRRHSADQYARSAASFMRALEVMPVVRGHDHVIWEQNAARRLADLSLTQNQCSFSNTLPGFCAYTYVPPRT